MRQGRGLALCLALLLCLTGCALLEENPLEDPQAQAIVDAVQAIPAENLQFTLYNPLAVDGAPRALATEGMTEVAVGHGFSVTVCEETHLAALQTLLADLPLVWMQSGEDLRTDGGAALTLRLFDGQTQVQQFTLQEGQLYASLRQDGLDHRYCFSVDRDATLLLMQAVGRQPK